MEREWVSEQTDSGGNVYRAYFRGNSTAPYLTTVNAKVTSFREVRPLRAEDYPVLAEIWSGDEDDDIFTEEPAK